MSKSKRDERVANKVVSNLSTNLTKLLIYLLEGV